uniref:Uncharacterized protein n=1 Tax=Nelumbo nucifera TaxID=4432 RepID=A0A822Z4F2_NELNU|nr:TPA_asm: hypothetical protein HUJ06_014020 [Nelumbo nucifera]
MREKGGKRAEGITVSYRALFAALSWRFSFTYIHEYVFPYSGGPSSLLVQELNGVTRV